MDHMVYPFLCTYAFLSTGRLSSFTASLLLFKAYHMFTPDTIDIDSFFLEII